MATYAQVDKRARNMGLRVDQLGDDDDEHGRFWLVAVDNWQTTEPGRSLDEISAELDELEHDGGVEPQ